jgi:hypothetical protein
MSKCTCPAAIAENEIYEVAVTNPLISIRNEKEDDPYKK